MVAAPDRAEPDARVAAAVSDLSAPGNPDIAVGANVGGSMVVVDRVGGVVNHDVAETELNMV